MNRLRTLPSVILNTDRSPLKRAEELAIVIGLAASRLRQNLDSQEERLFTTVRRTAVIVIVAMLIIAVIGAWWITTNARNDLLPYLIVGTLIVLALAGIAFVVAPYTKRFRVSGEQAAVTRVSRLYYPVGILPLAQDRAVIWDALTEKTDALQIVDLPPTLGVEQETAVTTANQAQTALDALTTYEDELYHIKPEPVGWPANVPDASAQQVGAEVGDLWKRMNVLMTGDPGAVLNFSGGSDVWRAVADEGERLHTFHQEIESLRLLIERYTQRAQTMVDHTRDLALEHGAGIVQQVSDDRTQYFNGNGHLPTAPGQYLSLNIGNTAERVKANLQRVQDALKPLDAEISNEHTSLAGLEETALGAIETNHQNEREELTQEERNIAALDSDILKLATTLETHSQRITDSREKLLKGFEAIAQTPMADLRNEVQSLESAVQSATTVINDSAPHLSLPALDGTLAELNTALNQAHTVWTKLSDDLPRRGEDMRWRLETIQDSLKKIADTPVAEGTTPPDTTQINNVLKSVQGVERIARDMVNWTTLQQDPLNPIEDKENDLNANLNTLKEVRRKLEQASATFTAATATTAATDNKHALGLPVVLQRVETALGDFIRHTEDNRAATAALTNAAETVQKQSERISTMLQERDKLRTAYQQRSEALLKQVQAEREQVRQVYTTKRDALTAQRATLNRVHNAVSARVDKTLANPVVESTGVLQDMQEVPWHELVVNQMNIAIDQWAGKIAGLDGQGDGLSLLQSIRDQIEACYQAIENHAVSTSLSPEDHPLTPHICFVPFWYVETEQDPGTDSRTGRTVHIFPPLHLDRPTPTDMPTIEGLRYRELSRRLLAYVRRDFLNGGDPLHALSFDPSVLTDAAKTVPVEAGGPLWQELATALAQHWVFFRSDDALLNRIVLNSRDHLLPAEQIVEAWLQNAQQAALPDDQGQLPS